MSLNDLTFKFGIPNKATLEGIIDGIYTEVHGLPKPTPFSSRLHVLAYLKLAGFDLEEIKDRGDSKLYALARDFEKQAKKHFIDKLKKHESDRSKKHSPFATIGDAFSKIKKESGIFKAIALSPFSGVLTYLKNRSFNPLAIALDVLMIVPHLLDSFFVQFYRHPLIWRYGNIEARLAVMEGKAIDQIKPAEILSSALEREALVIDNEGSWNGNKLVQAVRFLAWDDSVAIQGTIQFMSRRFYMILFTALTAATAGAWLGALQIPLLAGILPVGVALLFKSVAAVTLGSFLSSGVTYFYMQLPKVFRARQTNRLLKVALDKVNAKDWNVSTKQNVSLWLTKALQDSRFLASNEFKDMTSFLNSVSATSSLDDQAVAEFIRTWLMPMIQIGRTATETSSSRKMLARLVSGNFAQAPPRLNVWASLPFIGFFVQLANLWNLDHANVRLSSVKEYASAFASYALLFVKSIFVGGITMSILTPGEIDLAMEGSHFLSGLMPDKAEANFTSNETALNAEIQKIKQSSVPITADEVVGRIRGVIEADHHVSPEESFVAHALTGRVQHDALELTQNGKNVEASTLILNAADEAVHHSKGIYRGIMTIEGSAINVAHDGVDALKASWRAISGENLDIPVMDSHSTH